MNESELLLWESRAPLGEEEPPGPEQSPLENHVFNHHGVENTDVCGAAHSIEAGSQSSNHDCLDVDEETKEQQLQKGITSVIDLTGIESDQDEVNAKNTLVAPQIPRRNATINERDLFEVFELGHDGLFLKPGMTVEIQEITDLYRAAFLQIQCIYSSDQGVVLRGLPFTRTRFLRGKLPRYRNEVCLVLQVDKDDTREDEVQGAIEVPVTNVIRIREMKLTNADFPQNRLINVDSTVDEIERLGILVCRWKYRLLYKKAGARHTKQAPYEFVLAHLRSSDASTSHGRVSDTTRLNAWRGSRVRGGSYNKYTRRDLEAFEDIDEYGDERHQWIEKAPGQRYTVADMFSGAGGTSLGAQQAGFHIRLACDIDRDACITHRMNFPEADLREDDIWTFIKEDLVWGGKRDFVDVLHLSPPCQFWSPAHTVEGKNDEANIAVLFSCQELVKKLKPRVFTLEQTFGILHPRFEHYFNALVRGFTQYSYSVRWKVMNLMELGLPSRRNRLIMIGACPGESLPTFPENTHTRNPPSGSHLKAYRTVMDAMRLIPPDASLHEKVHTHNWAPWDPNIPLARCITTHGGYGNYHYSGRRHFTLRELATMNGFPATYLFHGKNAKRQIGNAFPPSVVRILYSHLLKWLENEDQVRSVEEQTCWEEEPEHYVLESEFEDDIVITAVRVKRGKNSQSEAWSDSADTYTSVLCIDAGQPDAQEYIDLIDLTADSPKVFHNRSPIIVSDDENSSSMDEDVDIPELVMMQ